MRLIYDVNNLLKKYIKHIGLNTEIEADYYFSRRLIELFENYSFSLPIRSVENVLNQKYGPFKCNFLESNMTPIRDLLKISNSDLVDEKLLKAYEEIDMFILSNK